MTSEGANAEEGEGSKLQAPEQLLLHRWRRTKWRNSSSATSSSSASIPRPASSATVCLPEPFVQHYRIRHDGALPTVTAS